MIWATSPVFHFPTQVPFQLGSAPASAGPMERAIHRNTAPKVFMAIAPELLTQHSIRLNPPARTAMRFGTPLSPNAIKVMLLGSGELGKEVIIELQRLGVETIAVDRYANAPASQVAHRAHVIDMTDAKALRAVVERERPHLVVPEIEALATDELVRIEAEGLATVIPTARAAHVTMNRERIRVMAAEELKLPTSAYAFASSLEELQAASSRIGFPCFVKPVMSSSGKGQSRLKSADDVAPAWEKALSAGRVREARVIVEGEIRFDFEVTQLTVRAADGTHFCAPIGHVQ